MEENENDDAIISCSKYYFFSLLKIIEFDNIKIM